MTIRPGDTGIVDPNPNDPNSACSVYTEGDASYLGCLLFPTGSEAPKTAFEVSRMDASIPDDKCGD